MVTVRTVVYTSLDFHSLLRANIVQLKVKYRNFTNCADLLPLLPPMSFMVLLHYRCHLYYIYIHFKPHKIRFFWFKQPCVLGNMCILEIASYSYLDRYHFWCFSFLAEDLSFCLVSFPFNPKKNFLQHFLWCTSALTSKF